MNVIITGDSHTAALYKGQLALQADRQWPDDVRLTVRPLGGGHLTRDPFFRDRGEFAEITTAEYRRQFERLPLEDLGGEETTYGLSAPLHSARIWRHPDWRSFAPIGVRADAVPVSLSMTRRIMLDDQKYILELIEILIRNGKRVFAIEAPHPFRHHPALRGTPADVVLGLNHLYRTTLRERLNAMDVPVVSVPERCLDGGFMRPDYAQPGDAHHGNTTYGRIMMGEILASLPVRARADRLIVPDRSSVLQHAE